MNMKQKVNESIDKMNNQFDSLISKDTFNIDSIEQVSMENIIEYKDILNRHIEEVIKDKVNEKELISKKNRNGRKEDID